jgi:tRNA U34 5-methylaminomethyl-2-thiouridine-forming methyltransferase MnmC
MDIEIFTTGDGSNSLYVRSLNENYHSRNGAISESLHVYIRAGFLNLKALYNPVNILEVGFGTGLNAYLTLLECTANNINVNYHAVEPFPLPEEIFQKLNYPEILEVPGQSMLFQKMHQCQNDKPFAINANFILTKIWDKIENLLLQNSFYHLVYFDAFAPEVQKEIWNQEVFNSIFKGMGSGGILVTYCAKGAVRRILHEAGFIVERLNGPTGKREMLRATKLSQARIQKSTT